MAFGFDTDRAVAVANKAHFVAVGRQLVGSWRWLVHNLLNCMKSRDFPLSKKVRGRLLVQISSLFTCCMPPSDRYKEEC